MTTSSRPRRNGEQHNALQDEQSPLLPRHDRRKTSNTGSGLGFGSFLWKHALSPLPEIESGGEALPSAYLPPLLLQCLITGLADASTFTLTKAWVGFMTGNMVQMIINAFDVLLPSDSNADNDVGESRKKLYSNISSLLGFAIGCQLTGIVVQRLSTDRTKRITLVLISIYRSIVTLCVIIFGVYYPAFRLSGSLGWLVIMIMASSLGSQSTYTTSLSTPFANTVVFTATLTSVASDLQLVTLHLSTMNYFKLLSMLGLFGGAALSQVVLKAATAASRRDKHEAVQHALIVLSGMELLLGLLWYMCGIVSHWKQYRRSASSNPSNGSGETDSDRES
ncbi:hypothetical protein PHBOTO_001717 [Pseudozyma hubeiensis]|nr:hypothetical protein PHBOTO_001717 [Pseudozyma hubeiensis]